MRPNNTNNRWSRGRGGRKSGNSRNQTFDSNGPGARVRGNASQIYEKYQQLARDAASSSDRVGAENFLQHAEHYYRLMIANGPKPETRNNADGQQDESFDGNSTETEMNVSGDNNNPASENASSDDGGSNADERRDAESGNGNEAKPAPRKRRARKPRSESVETDAAPAAENESGEEAEVSPA